MEVSLPIVFVIMRKSKIKLLSAEANPDIKNLCVD